MMWAATGREGLTAGPSGARGSPARGMRCTAGLTLPPGWHAATTASRTEADPSNCTRLWPTLQRGRRVKVSERRPADGDGIAAMFAAPRRTDPHVGGFLSRRSGLFAVTAAPVTVSCGGRRRR